MTLELPLARSLLSAGPAAAWEAIFAHAWDVCSAPIHPNTARKEVAARDQQLGDLDLWLATAGWDLWRTYLHAAPRNAARLAEWWSSTSAGRAILVLDALSLREVPWILEGAKARGYALHRACAYGSELPGDTESFAKALGFSGRSALDNAAGHSARFPGAHTESLGIAWEDAAAHVGAEPRWFLWHHWPDDQVHALSEHGSGLGSLTDDAAKALTSDGFWQLVERLTTGRRLLITSDHGYASSGTFPDTSDGEQARDMKVRFGQKRHAKDDGSASPWVPPSDIALATTSGPTRFVLGRRKWKAAGGYPTLTHGGLSILEVASPFVEISRATGA